MPDGLEDEFHEIRRFISTGLCYAEQASKDKTYISGLISMGTLRVRVESCLPPAFLPGFPGRLTSPFQGLLSWGYIQSPKPHRVVPNRGDNKF